MNITTPSLALSFLGNDLASGHSTSQTISNQYIVNNSIKFRMTLMSGLKSASNQVQLSIAKNCPSVEDIIATDGDVKAILKDGDTVLFTGYISTSFSWNVTKNGEQALTITLEDVSTRLLSKPFLETGYHLFNATAADAIDDICDAAGIVVGSDAIVITDRVTFVAEAGVTCRELLDQMLYELGYVYYCNNLGELYFFKVDVTSVEDLPVLDKENLYEKNGQAINLSKKIRQYRSVRMTYTALGTAPNYLVYRNTTGQDDVHSYCNMPLQGGEHFDGLEIYTAQQWSEETADEFREPALIEACNAASETEIVGSNKIIAISELSPVVQKGQNITVSMTAAGGPYIEINAQNSGIGTEYITRMDLYASILYEKSQNIIRTGISGGTTDSLYTEDCQFIHTKDLMTRHANLVCQYNAYCNSKYTFYSSEDLDCGTLVHLNDNVFSGLSVNVMIVAKTDTDDSSIIKYEAVGVSVFSLDDDVYHRDTDGGKANTKGQKGTSSRWSDGTALVGTTFSRGVAGNDGDYYFNNETYNIYRCIISGGLNTALWQYVGNNKGKDATVQGFTFEVEFGFSISDTEFIFPDATYGYDSSHAYGYDEDNEYGFEDYVWSPSLEGWYHGLYVWTRVKKTDEKGDIYYDEPTYSGEVTQSLINSCILQVSALPDAYTSNMRDAGDQYLSLTIKDIGCRGALTLRTDTGIFAVLDAETGFWEDLTNAIEIHLRGTNTLTNYGIKLPYANETSVMVEGDFEEWTEEEFSIPSLSISPCILDVPVVMLETVNTFAELPTRVNTASQEANINDKLIKGDYILVKYLTLTPTSETEAIDEVGQNWLISDLSSYYNSNLEPITITEFVIGTTYYAFNITAWMHTGTNWTRDVTPSVEVNTVSKAVELAKNQHQFDSSVDYHKCLYAHKILVENLTASIIEAGDIFANNIQSNNYGEDSAGTPIRGYKLEHKSEEAQYGQIKSYGGVYCDMSVRKALILWKDNQKKVGADIQHPSLSTVPGSGGDEVGTSPLPNPEKWNIKTFYNNSSIAANQVIEGSVSGSFGNDSISKVLRLTNPNAVAASAVTTTMEFPFYPDGVSISFTVPAGHVNSTLTLSNAVRPIVEDSHLHQHPLLFIIYKNGVELTRDLQGLTFPYYIPNVNAGDVITIGTFHTPFDRIRDGYPGSMDFSLPSITFAGLGFTSQGFYINTGSWINLGTNNLYWESTQDLSLTIGSTHFSTDVCYSLVNNLVGYANQYAGNGAFFGKTNDIEPDVSATYYTDKYGNGAVSGANVSPNFPKQADNTTLYYEKYFVEVDRVYKVDSLTVELEGESKTILLYARSANSCTLTFNDGTSVTFSSGEYHNICKNGGAFNVTLAIGESLQGVEMMGCYPTEDNLYDNGSPIMAWRYSYAHNHIDVSTRESKTDIEPFTRDAIELINEIGIVSFRYKKGEQSLHCGFIADDTDELLSGNRHDGMRFKDCIGVLFKAIQQMSAEIERLKGGNR